MNELIDFDKNKKKFLGYLITVIIGMIVIILMFFCSDDKNVVYSAESEIVEKNIKSIDNSNYEEKNTKSKELIKVYIVGEIQNVGVYELEVGSRLEDLVNLAGGFKEKANVDDINLAYELCDGEKIIIQNIENKKDNEINVNEVNDKTINTNTNTNKKVNINNATRAELLTLPGIGESTAIGILEYRKTNGRFENKEDIKNVSGIGESKFLKIENFITVK